MKKFTAALACFVLVFSAATTRADTLKGSTVRAQLIFLNDPSQTNYFSDPLDKIGSGKEFSYDDLVATYTANFSDTGLTIRVLCDAGISLKKCDSEPGFGMLFKDDVFVNATILEETNTLGQYLIGFDPDNAKIFAVVAPDPVTLKNSKLVLDIIPAPEPSSIVLLGTGMLGFATTFRRRFNT